MCTRATIGSEIEVGFGGPEKIKAIYGLWCEVTGVDLKTQEHSEIPWWLQRWGRWALWPSRAPADPGCLQSR